MLRPASCARSNPDALLRCLCRERGGGAGPARAGAPRCSSTRSGPCDALSSSAQHVRSRSKDEQGLRDVASSCALWRRSAGRRADSRNGAVSIVARRARSAGRILKSARAATAVRAKVSSSLDAKIGQRGAQWVERWSNERGAAGRARRSPVRRRACCEASAHAPSRISARGALDAAARASSGLIDASSGSARLSWLRALQPKVAKVPFVSETVAARAMARLPLRDPSSWSPRARAQLRWKDEVREEHRPLAPG